MSPTRTGRLFLGLLTCVSLVGCGSGNQGAGAQSSGAGTHTIGGTLDVDQDFTIGTPEGEPGCTATSFGEGTVITVSSNGTTLATGTVTSSTGTGSEGTQPDTGFDCQVPIMIEGVPDADFYMFAVQGSSDVALTISKADLEAAGWEVELRQNLS